MYAISDHSPLSLENNGLFQIIKNASYQWL